MPGRGRSAGRLAKKEEEEENWGQTEGAWRTLRREERSERTAVVGCVGCLSRDCLGEEGCEGEACDGKQHDHLRKQRKRGREGGREGRRGQEDRERDGWLRQPLTSARRVPVFRPWTTPSPTLNTIPSSLAAPDAQARTRPTGYHPSQYTALALLIRTCPRHSCSSP